MTIDNIKKTLELLQPIRDHLKQTAMIFQYDLKVEIATKLGINWKELDLPYEDWARISAWWFEGEQDRIDRLQEAFWGGKIVRDSRGMMISWN